MSAVIGGVVFGFTPGDSSQPNPAAVTVSEETGDGEYVVQVVQMNGAESVTVSAGGDSITLTSAGESASVSLAENDELTVKSVGDGSEKLIATEHQTSAGAGTTSVSKSGGGGEYSQTVSSFDSGTHNNTQTGSVKLAEKSGPMVIDSYSIANDNVVAENSNYVYIRSGTNLLKVDIETGQEAYSKSVFPSGSSVSSAELSNGHLYVQINSPDDILKIDNSNGNIIYQKGFTYNTFTVDGNGNLYMFKSDIIDSTEIDVKIKDASDYSDKWSFTTTEKLKNADRAKYKNGYVYVSGGDGLIKFDIDVSGNSYNHEWTMNANSRSEIHGDTDGNLIVSTTDGKLRLVDTTTGNIEHEIDMKRPVESLNHDTEYNRPVEDVRVVGNEIKILHYRASTAEVPGDGPDYVTYDKTLSIIDEKSTTLDVESVYITGDSEFTTFGNGEAKIYDTTPEVTQYKKSGTYKSKRYTLDTPADISTLKVDIGNVPQGGEVKIELLSAKAIQMDRYKQKERISLSEKTITSSGTVEIPVRATTTNNFRFRITIKRGDDVSKTPVINSVSVSGPLNKDSDVSSEIGGTTLKPRFKLSKSAFDAQVDVLGYLVQQNELTPEEATERKCKSAGDLTKQAVNNMDQTTYDNLKSQCSNADIPSRDGGDDGLKKK